MYRNLDDKVIYNHEKKDIIFYWNILKQDLLKTAQYINFV